MSKELRDYIAGWRATLPPPKDENDGLVDEMNDASREIIDEIESILDRESSETSNLVDDLETAKRNVRWLLDNREGLVDMKGLGYWAGRVVALRNEIKEA